MCSIDEMVEPPPASNSVSLDLQEFLHALGIKDPEQRELEEQEKQRQGNDGLGLEKRYAYFTAYLAGLDDHDRAQHESRVPARSSQSLGGCGQLSGCSVACVRILARRRLSPSQGSYGRRVFVPCCPFRMSLMNLGQENRRTRTSAIA